MESIFDFFNLKVIRMQSAQDFRYTAHTLLLALDATTITMMQLVSGSLMGTPAWKSAVVAQHGAFTDLHLHLGQPGSEDFTQGVTRH
jgi:hypothetical protein